MNEKFERIYNEIIKNNSFDEDIVELWEKERKEIGDFANYIVFKEAIKNR